jgi:tetratricopeptide (TPR) repeat protein
VPSRSDALLDRFDPDTLWALAFIDDAAALFLRRDGALAALADSFAYRLLPAGRAGWARVAERSLRDTAYRAALRAELARSAASSARSADAHSQLANLAMLEGRVADARRHLELALAGDPFMPTLHERLGSIALDQGRPADAVREYRAERALGPARPGLELGTGRAWEALGDRGRARAAYRRELARFPGSGMAREALERLERGAR